MPDGIYLRNTDVSAAEWQARCELAALYHVCNYLGWTDLINTHMSVRVPGEPNHFLINRYGEMFDEITASSLVKMDFDGNVVDSEPALPVAGRLIDQRPQFALQRAMIGLGALAQPLHLLLRHALDRKVHKFFFKTERDWSTDGIRRQALPPAPVTVINRAIAFQI